MPPPRGRVVRPPLLLFALRRSQRSCRTSSWALLCRARLVAPYLLLTILLLATAPEPARAAKTAAEAAAAAAAATPPAWPERQQPQTSHTLPPPLCSNTGANTGHDDDPRAPTAFPRSFWLVKTIKTGGTTLAGVLRTLAARHGVAPISKRRIGPLEGLPDAEAAAGLARAVLAARNATDASEFALITHLAFSEAKFAAFERGLTAQLGVDSGAPAGAAGRPLLLTSVRHPLARTYSHFIQSRCAVAAASLGAKIVACDRNATVMAKVLAMDTVMARWAWARAPARHNALYHYVRGNASSPAEALARYDFVFVAERMDESLVAFMLQYGLGLQDIAHLPSKVRAGKYRAASSMPRELNDYVLSVNQRDLELWTAASAALDARLDALRAHCGDSVVADTLAAFAALQAEVAAHCGGFEAWYAARGLPAAQHTYVNDEGWGWRCTRHVAQQHVERGGWSAGGAVRPPPPQAKARLPAVT